MEYSPEQITGLFEEVRVLRENVTKLRAQGAALIGILQTTPGAWTASWYLAEWNSWQAFEREYKFQEEKIRRSEIL